MAGLGHRCFGGRSRSQAGALVVGCRCGQSLLCKGLLSVLQWWWQPQWLGSVTLGGYTGYKMRQGVDLGK